MGILPVDLQAIIVRMDNVSKLQQNQQEAAIIAQLAKGEELSERAQVESARVNEVEPHPEEKSKIEEEKGRRNTRFHEHRRGGRRRQREKYKQFEEPYKGTIIDLEK